jgi:hypothetical protein
VHLVPYISLFIILNISSHEFNLKLAYALA